MSIERDKEPRFHKKGTLEASTRWMSSHPDGIAEWFKNVRRQFQEDRANVALEHRVAVLLLKDAKEGQPARIGLLDVGGATLEDVSAWGDHWNDPTASHRGSTRDEEQTQGNGGKAYMYRLFAGPTRILGVKNRRRNCRGFEGDLNSEERGTPGWIPSLAAGREVEISSFESELREVLSPYDVTIEELPESVRVALRARSAFALVEGQSPEGLYKGRIDADDFVTKIVRHEQSTLCLEQIDFYVIHNGRLLNNGQRLQLPTITPYPGIESPRIYEIPDTLPLDNGEMVSTTEGGLREPGRLLLHTSAENMQAAYKNLRPRWQIIYRTKHQMIGSKAVSELAGSTPGALFVYGTVELAALEPAYVEHGRRRPKPGPLTEALDRFITERIKEVAQEINSRRQEKLDDRALDEVQEENRKLDELKNRYLPSDGGEGKGGTGKGGTGGAGGGGGGSVEWGEVPEEIVYSVSDDGIDIGIGLTVAIRPLLELRVNDANGRPVRSELEWFTSDRHIVEISQNGHLKAKEKGDCEIWITVKGTEIVTARIPVRVWMVDHVLLTPRTVDIPLGTRQTIVAEVTSDEGQRSTDVLLEWRHDADDPLLVRISHSGNVTGNRLGRTAVSAGANNVWARIPVEVNVIPNDEKLKKGGGFPRLLLTGRDLDPATGTVREGDPDQPPIWQDPSDYIHNVWWLNLQSPEAAFAFRQRSDNPAVWRTYHAGRLVDMVVQVWMAEEFTRKGESQREEFWAAHLAAMDRHRARLLPEMWKRLESYVTEGRVFTGDEE